MMMMHAWCSGQTRLICLGLALGALVPAAALAAEPVDFNRDVRPLLSKHCLVCHGPDEAERAADLRLDTQAGSREDLGGYAAIVPGDAGGSELIKRLTSEDEDLRMPPAEKGRPLSDAEIELLVRWIEQGASYARHWAYEPPQRPELPAVARQDWPRNPVDHFILARLEAAGLAPSAEADRWTLARRAALDLTGLPPTWDEASALAHDPADDAYERYVDRLLAKQSFGERWARVWLDLARYADSAGYADDPPRTIWAYRDYVIRSLNENKPFDQFTIEQIAGDLLEGASDEQRIATAFHRNTLTNNEGGTNDEEFRNVAVVDRVNTTMAVWMGTTMACAQCHTHKYDPITQEEYFQFFALFNNTEDADKRDEQPVLEIWSEEQQSQQQQLRAKIETLRQRLAQSTPELEAAQADWLAQLHNGPQWRPLLPQQASARIRSLHADAEGWIHAEGPRPDGDDYVLQYRSGNETLSGLKLEVPAEQTHNFVLSQVSASWSPEGQRAIDARYVRIELPGQGKMIHLAEVQVFSAGENVAISGTAKQSSTDFGGDVQRVHDGDANGDYGGNSVSHTAIETDPWLELDLGASRPIDRIVIWNRTDGGPAIRERLRGFRVSLLSEQRAVLWQQAPDEVPDPSTSYDASGTIELAFAAALADHQQDGFPASSVLAAKLDPNQGWAVAPQQGQPHQLTLLLHKPLELAEGVLTVRLHQSSAHPQHVLDRFRIAATSDGNVGQWAVMPAPIAAIARQPLQEQDDAERQQLAAYYRGISPLLEPLRADLAEAEKQLVGMKPHTSVPVMRELPPDRHRETHVQIRGNYQSLGAKVLPGTPAAFHPLPDDAPPDRLGLARWLVDDRNPLTPRVIANRHWEELFGVGIVETSEEFGSQGELPSHPLLLDWLAVNLRDSGWDLKRLLKLLVTSATYRQSSFASGELLRADPQNRLHGRGPRFRISAEMVRDQALFVSGLLSEKLYGPGVNPPQPTLGLAAAFGSATDWTTSAGDDRYRRGLYTSWRRSSPYPSLAQFDAPNREVCTVRRIRTNTPLQALVTLNDPVYVEAAQALARLLVAAGDTPAERVEQAYHRCLIRQPSEAEIKRLTQLAADVMSQYRSQPDEARRMASEPLGDLPAGADAAELAAWTVVANVILNLDETLMKR
jgi:hypothetical protein